MSTIFQCQNPVKVWNRYTKEFQLAPCRKCALCKSRVMQRWTAKLNRESKCHKYVFFGTLTYSPAFLPYLSYDFKMDSFCSEDGTLSISLNELNDYLDEDSIKYLSVFSAKIPYAPFQHAQSFIKRLRSRVRSNPSGEGLSDRYIRYFVCREYGETIFRPHFHFLIFTNSSWFAEHAKDVVASCWSTDGRFSRQEQFGSVQVELVVNSASSYVSSYLNCSSCLPKVFTFRKLRSACIFSKLPSIGSLFSSSEEIQELFDSGSVTRTVRGKNNEVFQAVLEKSFCDRLYPRIAGFSRFPVDVLFRVYQSGTQFLSYSFEEFKELIYGFSGVREFLDDNNQRWRTVDVSGKFNLNDYFGDSAVTSYMQWLLDRSINTDTDSSLRCFLSTINRFALQANNFGISYRDYFDRIVDFWNRREKELLRSQCEYQERISKDTKDDFAFFSVDPIYRESVSSDKSFCKRVFYDSCTDFSQERDVEYVNRLSLAQKIVDDGKKRHLKWEYIEKSNLTRQQKNYLKFFHSKFN